MPSNPTAPNPESDGVAPLAPLVEPTVSPASAAYRKPSAGRVRGFSHAVEQEDGTFLRSVSDDDEEEEQHGGKMCCFDRCGKDGKSRRGSDAGLDERGRASSVEMYIDDDRRRCTDTSFCVLFALFWVGMLGIFALAQRNGDPRRLIYPTDYRGTTCGTGDMAGKSKIYYPRLQEDLIDVLKFDGKAYDEAAASAGGGAGGAGLAGSGKGMHFYGVCVADCPKGDSVVTDAAGNAWPVPLNTANILFRCLSYNNVTSVRKIRCTEFESGCVGAGTCAPSAWVGCYHSFGCKSTLNRLHPTCTKAQLDRNTLTDLEAKSNPIFELLSSTGELFTRWVGDLIVAAGPIIICGGGVALVASLSYLLVLQYCAYYMVWGTVLLAYTLLLALTFTMCKYGGLLDDSTSQGALMAKLLGEDFAANTNGLVTFEDYGLPSESDKSVWYRYAAYVLLALDLVAACVLLFLRSRIGIAVGIIREASNAVRAMPMILVFPLIPSALGMALMSYWLVAAGYLASSGTLLTDAADVTRTGGGPMGMGANATVAYYQTDEWVGKALVFHFFGLLWTKEFIYGFGVVTIAGSVADYYWCVDKKTLTSRPVWTSARRALRYHTGTLAMGSLIIAFITLCRAVLEYIDKQSKRLQDRNCAVKLFMCSFRCCLWCFEKCVRFVSTQGYIITSIKGAGFCKGTMQAFALLWKHLAKVGTVHIMASFILRLGSVCVVSVSSMAMLKLINDPPASFWIPIIGTVNTLESAGQAVAQVSSPILPLLATMLLAYAVSSYVLTVYSMAIDTLLMCFCEDLTVNKDTGLYFCADSLMRYIKGTATKYAFRSYTEERDKVGVGWHKKKDTELTEQRSGGSARSVAKASRSTEDVSVV